MKEKFRFGSSHASRGAVLVLVLCFVVLLTVLVVAYFSRTLVSRKLSNASTNAVQASTIANGAVDVIVGDLKQEIVNGATLTPAGNNPTYTLNSTQAANAVPQRNVAPAATATGGVVPNFVRRSARGDAMSGNSTDYVPPPAVTSRASAVSSTAHSLNGRYVSRERWNSHYLVPTVAPSAGSSASATTPVADFLAPDWVYVTAEQGPSVLNTPTKDASGNAVTVTGRYAYAIYDEGGLLDINHTGYPSASLNHPEHIGAKPAAGYADLTQLTPRDPSMPKMTTAAVDGLLAWRQYATLQATGNYPDSLQPSASQEAAYYGLFTSNLRSLMQVPLTYWNKKTDQTFLSRQQLISFFTTAATLTSPAKLDPWYLQFLGTFNRSLNQPSYAPEPNRPQVLDPSSGGNNSSGNTGITPNFLTAVVAKDFDRPTGVTPPRHAFANEPLVKRRFPLNRLAWLTYRGPSHDRNLTDPDMAALVNAYGITADFLQQGTEANIEYYFGLAWQGSSWKYIHGSNTTSGAILNISNVNRPVDVVRMNREPDFFEMLKASINPGSVAKTSLSPDILLRNSPDGKLNSAQAQYKLDSSLDDAVMQIGANIIDQFDTDGFPTQISYDLTSSGQYANVYGDENLPRISQVRAGLIRLVPANPTEVATDPSTDPIKDTGIAALMNFPELWNPHDWSSASQDLMNQSFGQVGPTHFKIYAETPSYNNTQRGNSVYAWNVNTASNSYQANRDKSPGFQTAYGFSFGASAGGELRTLEEANTQMTFSISRDATGGTLFREPTILYRPGYPGGSGLASTALVYSTNDVHKLGNLTTGSPNNKNFFPTSGGGLLSGVTAPTADWSGTLVPKNAAYIGFYIGAHPLRWWDDNVEKTGRSIPAYQSEYGPINDIKYTLACDDGQGGWILYDSKSITTVGEPNAYLNTGSDAGFGLNGAVGTGTDRNDEGLRFFAVVDPRTSRFGMVDPWVSSNECSIPPRNGYSYVSATEGTVKSARDDASSGAYWFYNNYAWSGFTSSDWYSATMGWHHGDDAGGNDSRWLRPGLLSQNDPNFKPDGNTTSTKPIPPGTGTTGTFPPFYYADADGVVRRASGAGVPQSATTTNITAGLPMAYAKGSLNAAYSSGGSVERQMDSRPVVLNRPFRSVAELGYVFSGTPWKNLDFFLPESGDVAMLDAFCVNDSSDDQPLSAGQVNLNTHQIPVIQAILTGAIKDLWYEKNPNQSFAADITILNDGTTYKLAQDLAHLLIQRTASPTGPANGPNANKGPQPFQNISDLVGRWVQSVSLSPAAGSNASSSAGVDGKASYDGFTTDLANYGTDTDRMRLIQRFGEGSIRALANAGQTRVWNLMFDIVAQTGRFPVQAQALVKSNAGTDIDQFNVEGEQHYWVHMAIDRCTGQVVDKQVEVVTE